MKRIISVILIAAMLLGLLAGCSGGEPGNTPTNGESTQNTGSADTGPTGSDQQGQNDNTEPTEPEEEPSVPTNPMDNDSEQSASGGGDADVPTNPDGDSNTELPIPGEEDEVTTTPGGTEGNQPSIPEDNDAPEQSSPGGNENADQPGSEGGSSTTPSEPDDASNGEEDKEVVLPNGGMTTDIPKELPESYLYPNSSVTKFIKNDSGIYENEYVRLDVTRSVDGYFTIEYIDPYASEFVVYLDETNALSHVFEQTYTYRYQNGSYKNGEVITIQFPTAEAEYYISITSTINEKKSKKLKLNLGLVVFKDTVSLDHIMPGEDMIQVAEVSKGIYENEYVRININTASKGYIQVDSLDPTAERVEVNLYSNMENQYGGKGRWHYNYKKGGKATIKAALTYGNATYEIEVWTTLTSEALGITRCTRKAVLVVTLDNVSNMGGFLLNTGEVIWRTNMQFIKKADEIAATCSNDFEKVAKIYAWFTDYLNYGISDAYTAVGSYTCNLETLYSQGYGVCYDYAVILAAMLRSQGIPCKVVFGKYTGSNYGHAWNEIYIDTEGGVTTEKVDIVGNKWCRLDPTMSHNNSGKASTDYMNDDSNYIWQFIY